jgi:hypothetical protein
VPPRRPLGPIEGSSNCRIGNGDPLRRVLRYVRNLEKQIQDRDAIIAALLSERDALRVRIEREDRLPVCSCGSLTPEVSCRRCGLQLG